MTDALDSLEEVLKQKNTSDLMLTCVVYMFPVYSRNVDFDEDTFNDIGFRKIQF